MNEKIKYFTTLLDENKELNSFQKNTNKTFLSNLEMMSNLNFNDSSLMDKSDIIMTNHENNFIIGKFFRELDVC